MEKQNVQMGWCKASMTLGVIATILSLLPLLSAWFMFLTTINYLLAPIGIICGVVAIVKSQNLTKSIIGLVLCVLALCIPFLLSDYYLESAADSVDNMLDLMDNF
ncbi:MAG: hypothetical protein J6L01_05560 [Alistipes sp.]|nr:hypothetical protein [Alistipes sp.]